MQITDILTLERTHAGLAATSKKRLLQLAAKHAAKALAANAGSTEKTPASPIEEQIFDALLARERLGSTALGEGVAVPHCRLPDCTQALGLLLQLAKGIDFDAPDGQAVDLLFVLIVPAASTDEHLALLGSIAHLFNQPAVRTALREARSSEDLYTRILAFEPGSTSG